MHGYMCITCVGSVYPNGYIKPLTTDQKSQVHGLSVSPTGEYSPLVAPPRLGVGVLHSGGFR